jgi:hypothetical protein
MATAVTKASLSEPRRRLVELMQDLHFGRIEHLIVRAGDPVLEPPPRIVSDITCGGDNGPRPEREATDFPLKQQVRELFRQLDELDEGTIELLEVKHGLPFRLLVPRPSA